MNNSKNYSLLYNEEFDNLQRNYVEAQAAMENARKGDQASVNILQDRLERNKNLLNKVSTIATFEGIKSYADHYNANGSLNQDVVSAGHNSLMEKGMQLEALRIKKFASQQDKEEEGRLTREMASWHKNLNEIRPLITSAIKGIQEGHYNEELSFADDIELGVAFKQWLDPNTKHRRLGVGTYFDNNGEMYISYKPGEVFSNEYKNNLNNIDHDPRVQQEMDVIEQQIINSLGGERVAIKQDPDAKLIKVKDVLSNLVSKDIKTNNKIKELLDTTLESSDAQIKTEDGKEKIYQHENFDSLRAGVFEGYKELFLSQDAATGEYANIHDLSTRDQLIAGKIRNYKKDLMSDNSFIHSLRYEDLGLDSSLDTNKDGFVSEGELDEDTKDIIYSMMTNPRSNEERTLAANGWAYYLTNLTNQLFDQKRERKTAGNRENIKAKSPEANEGLSEFAMQLIEKYSK